jgi:hypothetical protein
MVPPGLAVEVLLGGLLGVKAHREPQNYRWK